ncbi:MAG: S1C family serine protease [Planctomycetota bacterium]
MRTFTHYGPALAVAVAATAALVAAPWAIRRANDAQADHDIALASRVLASNTAVAPVAYTPSQSGNPAAASAADEPSAPIVAPILEQINRANRAIATLVEPSVVHVSTLVSMPRQMASPYGSSGSGWIWDEEGHIVTNAHVVDGASRVQVQFHDGELRDAEIVGLDLRSDIAVIKVSAGGMHPALRGDSRGIEQGDLVYAFGSPFDFRFSMSSGIVSGLGRTAGLADLDYENFIQTDAAINPGNSGGPLTDIRGRVIGMNTAIATGRGNGAGQGQFAGIGLAIPMAMIESFVTQIIDGGEVRKGFLGVQVMALDRARALIESGRVDYPAALVEDFKGEGAVVANVTVGSPAEEAGFRAGDVIVAIDGQRVPNDRTVPAMVSSRRPGEQVEFEVWRASADGGARERVVVTLGELDPGARIAPQLRMALERSGFAELATATDARAKRLGVPFRRGVIVESIAGDAEMAEAVPPGSTITAVFDQSIGSIDELYTRAARVMGRVGPMRRIEVPMTVTRPDGRVLQIAVPVP